VSLFSKTLVQKAINVYNMETESHNYIANEVVVSNCGIDEMAKFETTEGPRGGWQVRNALKASTKNFGIYGRMCEIGSPKNPTDPLMTLYKLAKKSPTMLAIRLASWEMNPLVTKDSYKEEFAIDYRAAMANYSADPQSGESLYFGNLDIFKWSESGNLLDIMYNDLPPSQHEPFDYVLAGDPSLKHDHFGLALGHAEGDKYIIDGAIAIGAEREINPVEVSKFILKVADVYYLKEFTTDTWYYAETGELLRQQGTVVSNHIVTKEDYDNFKKLVYLNKIVLPESKILREEISSIISTGAKIDHPRKGSKDVLDAVVNCIRILSSKNNYANQIVLLAKV
jgi:hypothetical protein